jgi:hypothetical protein
MRGWNQEIGATLRLRTLSPDAAAIVAAADE